MVIAAALGFLVFPIFVSTDIAYRSSNNKYKNIIALSVINLTLDQMMFFLILKRMLMITFFVGFWNKTVTYQQITLASYAFIWEVILAIAIGILFRKASQSKSRYEPISLKRKALLLLALSVVVAPTILGLYYGYQGVKHLTIVEVCRKQALEEDNKNISFYRIYNGGKFPCQMRKLFLSTDEDELTQYQLPEIVIAPSTAELIEVDFEKAVEIKKKGSSVIYLATAYGNLLDQIEIPPMEVNDTYRLTEDGWKVMPLVEHAEETVTIFPPDFSLPGGFYENSFELALTGEEGTTIYYSLDGSIPTSESLIYTEPITVYDKSSEENHYRNIQNVREEYLSHREIGKEPVDKAFIVRAVAIDKDGNSSEVVTQTYFIAKEKYENKYIVSLIASPDDLFGENGIYVTGQEYEEWYARKQQAESKGEIFEEERPYLNYRQRGYEWERMANLEIFNNGNTLVNQNAGIRIQGNSSRNYYLKRFSVYARKEYSGSSLFDVPLIGDKPIHSFVLRSGFDNAFSNMISIGRDVAIAETIPAVVFLNGEYWYDTYLEAKYNEAYLAEMFTVEKNDVELLQIGTMRNEDKDTQKRYSEVLHNLTSQDFSDDNTYKLLQDSVDIQSYIDYSCINIYLGNTDYFDTQNTCIWRTIIDEKSPYGDGRWRWALYDMDLNRSWNRGSLSTDAEINPFTSTGQSGLPALNNEGSMFASLKRNPEFCKQFVISFMDIVNTNFSVERVTKLLEELGEDISYDDYFFRDRAKYVTKYLADEFRLPGSLQDVTIHMKNPLAGQIKLNTITPDISEETWTGGYFTDYPIKLSVQESAGYEFDHWIVDGKTINDKEIEIEVKEGGSEIYVIFKP